MVMVTQKQINHKNVEEKVQTSHSIQGKRQTALYVRKSKDKDKIQINRKH